MVTGHHIVDILEYNHLQILPCSRLSSAMIITPASTGCANKYTDLDVYTMSAQRNPTNNRMYWTQQTEEVTAATEMPVFSPATAKFPLKNTSRPGIPTMSSLQELGEPWPGAGISE